MVARRRPCSARVDGTASLTLCKPHRRPAAAAASVAVQELASD